MERENQQLREGVNAKQKELDLALVGARNLQTENDRLQAKLEQNLNERLVLNDLLQKKEATTKKKTLKRPKSVTKVV